MTDERPDNWWEPFETKPFEGLDVDFDNVNLGHTKVTGLPSLSVVYVGGLPVDVDVLRGKPGLLVLAWDPTSKEYGVLLDGGAPADGDNE